MEVSNDSSDARDMHAPLFSTRLCSVRTSGRLAARNRDMLLGQGMQEVERLCVATDELWRGTQSLPGMVPGAAHAPQKFQDIQRRAR
jgi:hypothetical protein